MNFSKAKNGYSTAEVDAHLKSLEIAEQGRQAHIEQLKAEIESLKKQLDTEKNRRELINRAIYNAVAKADQIETLSKRKYEQDMAQLKSFHQRWTAYYNRLIQKYPLDDELKEVAAFNSRMNDVLRGKDAQPMEVYLKKEEERVIKASKIKDEIKPCEPFDPIAKIKEYLERKRIEDGHNNKQSIDESEEEGTFSFEEALNPTDDLSTIMKDLGFDVEE